MEILERIQLKLVHETDHGYVLISLIKNGPNYTVETNSVRYIKQPNVPRRKAEVQVTEYHPGLSAAKRAYLREIKRQNDRGFTGTYGGEDIAPAINSVKAAINRTAENAFI